MDESFRDRRKQAMHDGHIWILKEEALGTVGGGYRRGSAGPQTSPPLTSSTAPDHGHLYCAGKLRLHASGA